MVFSIRIDSGLEEVYLDEVHDSTVARKCPNHNIFFPVPQTHFLPQLYIIFLLLILLQRWFPGSPKRTSLKAIPALYVIGPDSTPAQRLHAEFQSCGQ